MGDPRDIPPFWTRLGQIAAYPFRGAALAALAALAATRLLSVLPVIGFLVVIVIWFAGHRYAFEILRATADGELEPPEHAASFDTGIVWRFIGLMLGFWAMVVVAWLGFGLAGVAVAIALLAIAQPGATISLAMDGSLPHALNPATWLGIMQRIGPAYAAAVALFVLPQLMAYGIGGLVADQLPLLVNGIVRQTLFFWGLFATFHLLGWMVLQYRDRLGYVAAAIEGDRARRPDPDRALLEALDAREAEGDAAGARDLLEEEMGSRAVGAAVHQRYRALLRRAGDRDAMQAHARRWIGQLLVEGEEARALALLDEAQALDPRFAPMDRDHAVQLLAAADRRGLTRAATLLREAAFRAWPRHPGAPALALAAAAALVEQLGEDARAAVLLDACEPRIEAPADRAELDRLRALMQRLKG